MLCSCINVTIPDFIITILFVANPIRLEARELGQALLNAGNWAKSSDHTLCDCLELVYYLFHDRESRNRRFKSQLDER